MTSLPKTYDPQLVEEKWYSFWEQRSLFKADPASQKKPYCIVMPPPNVTGRLHMGHALVNTLQDILIRWHRMRGFEALWIPGTDHAGISTQGIVEKNLFAQTGKKRADFSREEFLQEVWKWKELSEKQILGQLKKLGCSCDWSRLRFTMDEGNNQATRSCFKKMYEEGLIYQGDYLVNWDPVQQTALSDDEVEYEEREGSLWHIRYPLADLPSYIIVATTRPETMLGDTAVAVHPQDERYRHLIGKFIQLPLSGRKIPILADPFVDLKFGSGAVKITPAHDFNDFEVGLRHQLPRVNILTPDACLNALCGKWAGLSVEEAREQIVSELKKLHLIEKIEPHTSRTGIAYRSKAVVQPFLSKQWFVKTTHFKEKLISAVRDKRVTLIPPHWESTYFHWIENLRDWCISRQIWWGHRIPVWRHRTTGRMICSDEEGTPKEIEKEIDQWVQDPDVLDTWFSSALWPFASLGWPEKTEALKKFYPTSTLITGHDILFFWVARMILMGEYIQHAPPFREAFLHGLIYGKSYWRNRNGFISYITGEEKKKYDLGEPPPSGVVSKWEKMSKTKGNVIDPIEIIQEYGTDALRIALASSVTQARQIDLDLRKFEEFKNFANKLWNGARFVLLHLEDFNSERLAEGLDFSLSSLEDRWILSVLGRTVQEINEMLGQYAFDRASLRAYEFFWNDFCAIYLEASKPVLFGKVGTPEQRIHKQKLLLIVTLQALRLLHPITPFVTEELFSILKNQFLHLKAVKTADPYTKDAIEALLAPACIVAPYPRALKAADIQPSVEKSFEELGEIIRAIRNIRTEMQIPPSEKTDLYLIGAKGSSLRALAEEHQNLLLALTPTAQLFFVEKEPPLFGSSAPIKDLLLSIPIPESLRLRERARLEKEREKGEKLYLATQEKLNNQEFRLRAPQEIVAKLESALLNTQKMLEEIALKLKSL
jgi:valyl-tRNA synthetase